MANALDITDRESLERWLQDKSPGWAQLIALRAALRVLPQALPGQDTASNPDAPAFQDLILAVEITGDASACGEVFSGVLAVCLFGDGFGRRPSMAIRPR